MTALKFEYLSKQILQILQTLSTKEIHTIYTNRNVFAFSSFIFFFRFLNQSISYIPTSGQQRREKSNNATKLQGKNQVGGQYSVLMSNQPLRICWRQYNAFTPQSVTGQVEIMLLVKCSFLYTETIPQMPWGNLRGS